MIADPEQTGGPPQASIIVPCKGRLHQLRRTLPHMLAQVCDFAYEVIVVDFDCPQGTYDWCRELNVKALAAVKVLDNAEQFSHSRSRNCGARVARGMALAFVDADVRLAPGWLSAATWSIREGRAGLVTVANCGSAKGRKCIGTCAISADLFHALRGYDEALCGWNGEDMDLYGRAHARAKRGYYAPNLVMPIEHGDNERVAFQAEKNIKASSARNAAYLERRAGPVNPQGFGQGEVLVFHGQCDTRPPVMWNPAKRMVRSVARRRPPATRKAAPFKLY